MVEGLLQGLCCSSTANLKPQGTKCGYSRDCYRDPAPSPLHTSQVSGKLFHEYLKERKRPTNLS